MPASSRRSRSGSDHARSRQRRARERRNALFLFLGSLPVALVAVAGPPLLRAVEVEPHWGVYPLLLGVAMGGIILANRMRRRALNVTTSRRVQRAAILLCVAVGAAVYHWVAGG